MSGIKDQEQLEALRKRLYSRGEETTKRTPYQIPKSPVTKPIAETWSRPVAPKPQPTQAPNTPVHSDIRPINDDLPTSVPVQESESEDPVVTNVSTQNNDLEPMTNKKSRRHYRWKILLVGLFFFIVAVGISSLLLMSGGNTISGGNITMSVTGPFTIGGGEVLPLQVGITNTNSVPIKAATLIVEYPDGTQSAIEDGGELFIERLALETIGSGETLNIPLRALVFGEENSEKTITASIEYRVEGSNATFFKEATPLRFKISSAPAVLSVDSVKKISSGQETSIELKITSNAPTPLTDLLLRAQYPSGFDFVSSSPEPASGDNVWKIKTLNPQETVTIILKAIVVGKESDELAAHFSLGVPNDKEPFSLASIFTTDSVQFEIEQPFLDVKLSVDGKGNEAVVSVDQPVGVAIDFSNTLSDTIFDAVMTVTLSGNAVDDRSIEVPNGFYDSKSKTITWNSSEVKSLEQMVPGASERFSFTFEPSKNSRTPQIDFVVNVKARRVSENRVPEELIGTAKGFARVASEPKLLSEARYNVGNFTDTGPIPPEVETKTTYTVSLLVENGSNEISDAVITSSLPNYVTWLNNSDGDGKVSFNETTRVITWNAGSIDGKRTAITSFQVSLLPSTSQIGTTPTLIGEQRLKATDQFTGSTIRSSKAAVTTELSTEAGFAPGNGRVQE